MLFSLSAVITNTRRQRTVVLYSYKDIPVVVTNRLITMLTNLFDFLAYSPHMGSLQNQSELKSSQNVMRHSKTPELQKLGFPKKCWIATLWKMHRFVCIQNSAKSATVIFSCVLSR